MYFTPLNFSGLHLCIGGDHHVWAKWYNAFPSPIPSVQTLAVVEMFKRSLSELWHYEKDWERRESRDFVTWLLPVVCVLIFQVLI